MAAPKTPVGGTRPLRMSAAFKLVFLTVLCLTVLSLMTAVALALLPPERQSDDVRRLIETLSTTWKMGFGAIVGLIGGKALD